MISPPNWKKDAVPTVEGWRHPSTNELLQSTRITSKQIEEYNSMDKKDDKSGPEVLTESPTDTEQFINEKMVPSGLKESNTPKKTIIQKLFG